MAQTLEEFIKAAHEDVVEFEKWWRTKNAEDPEHFPLELESGNEGVWWEFLLCEREPKR